LGRLVGTRRAGRQAGREKKVHCSVLVLIVDENEENVSYICSGAINYDQPEKRWLSEAKQIPNTESRHQGDQIGRFFTNQATFCRVIK